MTKNDIVRVCDNTKNLLIKKNKAYGDSALEPLGIFGNGDAVVSLGARMDDKLMRLKSLGMGKDSVDTLYDLHGYITLLIIAIERKEHINSMDSVCDDDSNTGNLIKERENAGENNAVQKHNEHSGPTPLYAENSTGAYQDWQEQILDRESKRGLFSGSARKSSSGQDS